MIISEGSDCLWSFRSDVMIKGPELKHWYKYIFIYKDTNKIIITQPEKKNVVFTKKRQSFSI